MKIKRADGLLLGGAPPILAVAPVAASAADNADGPQAGRSAAAADYAPDLCLFMRQMHPAEQLYRNTNNTPFTYDVGRFGTDWFDVAWLGGGSVAAPAAPDTDPNPLPTCAIDLMAQMTRSD